MSTPAPPPRLGAVLAGGASQRFGAPKALHVWHGAALIDHVLAATRSALDDAPVGVVAPPIDAHAALFAHLCGGPQPTPVWHDLPGAQGPIAGLGAALERAQHHRAAWVFVTACDMPYVTPQVIRALWDIACAPAHTTSSAVVPVSAHGDEPLCAWYRVSAAWPAVQARIARGQRSLRGVIGALDDVVRIDAQARGWAEALRNVNRPGDLVPDGGPA